MIPETWTLSASAFNLTPEAIRAARSAPDLAVSLVSRGVADRIEVELGQLWRSFPAPATEEAAGLREALAAHGGGVSIVGASIDDWASATRRRSDDERLAFLEPQLRTAAALGAAGVRLPIGQAGPALLRRLVPILHELDLVLYEEAQGQQTPASPAHAAAYDDLALLDDPHVRLLIDISMLMPALPVSYLERLEASRVSAEVLRRLRDDWRDPATTGAVVAELRAGAVPDDIHTLFMNLLVRFGRSSISELEGVLPLLGGVHLKFWDLDDADGRVTAPIRDLGAALSPIGYRGTLCSEWGGHEWLDGDPWETTRAHLALARQALTEGAAA